MVVRKPHEQLGTTLLQNLLEYDSILSLFTLPPAPTPYSTTTLNQTQQFINFHRPSPTICNFLFNFNFISYLI